MPTPTNTANVNMSTLTHTMIMRYIWQKVIGEHYPEDDSLLLSLALLFMGETKKKQLTWLSTNPEPENIFKLCKTQKTLLFSKWTRVKKLHACFSHYQKRHAEMLYYQASKYAKPSGKETKSGSDWHRGNPNKTMKHVIKSTIRANTFHCLRRSEIVQRGVQSKES